MAKGRRVEGGTVRVVVTLPAAIASDLDALAASARFTGNRSMAAAWSIAIGAAVLSDESIIMRLFESPDDALAAFLNGGE